MSDTLPPLGVGLHENIDAWRYHADPCENPSLSRSLAYTLLNRSPMHAYAEHPRLGGSAPKKASPEMEFGDVVHQILLGKGAGFSIFEGKTWAGKEAGAFWNKAVEDGKTPIKRADYSFALQLISEVNRQMGDMGLGYVFAGSGGGMSEVVAVWEESKDCVCRAMMDRVFIDPVAETAEIWDLKTMGISAHPKACASRIIGMGYDMQDEHYTRGLRAVLPFTPRAVTFRFVFVETSPPFAVTPAELNGEFKAVAVSKMMAAYDLWGKCRAAGKWPGYTGEVVKIEAPAWALAAEMGRTAPEIS